MPNWSIIVGDLIPHGYCLSWQPHLLWLHGVSDVLTAISYYSIPVMLLVFVKRRQDLQFSWIFVLFGVFIMACGATHVMSLWTLWRPDYLAAGIVKAVTAAASVATALLLVPLLPKALALPGPAQWEAVHRKLRDEVAERSEAEAEVRRLNAMLEERVAARTAELEAANRSLVEANREARAGEERFRSVVESAPHAIMLVGGDGKITLVNARAEEMFGYARSELVGQSIDVLVPEPVRAGHVAHRAGYSAHPRPRAVGASGEMHGLRRDGSEIPVEIGLNPLRSAEGHSVLVTVIDTTERRAAEKERDARLAAEAASRAKSEFLSAMSHELRTPLNAILGYAQILARDAGLTERQATGLSTIAQSGEHLLMLINDLLDLAKIEAGKFDLAPAAVNLAVFLPVVADIIRIKAEEKSLLFAYEAPDELPAGVLADEKRLRQVLLNLLGNAVKFTDRGRVGLTVQLHGNVDGMARLRFEVIDSGIGMAPADLNMIFEPFEQVGQAQRRCGGTGLGLAISRQLVHLMGSDIQVESAPGAGSRFWFDLALPLAPAPLPRAAAAPSPRGYAGPRRKLLIADDVVGNRALLVELLGGLGFDLCEAVNGAEAVAQVRSQHPDLVLTDLVMPVMDGKQAIRSIRALPGLARLPIVAVSASADAAERAASLAAGADTFLPKPVDQERLLECIGTLLGLAWTYAEAAAPVPGTSAAAELAIPPREEMLALHQLALAGDIRGIRRRADHLAARDARCTAFAGVLQRLARSYQSQAILKLVEAHLKEPAS